MAYTIVKTNGTVLCTIADGTINTTAASIGLPGRNYAGYGQQLDTNFVHTLENFCSPTPPPNALQGQLWFNSSTQTMYVCPSDGEANASLWLSLATASSGSATTFGTINVTGNATAGNFATPGNLSVSGAATVGSLTVQANTVTANATVSGNLTASGNLIVTNITTGGASTPGTITGTYTVSGGVTGNAFIVTGGNVTVPNVAGAGIKADNYYYANGVAINFAGSYTDSNVRTLLTTGVPNVYVQTTLTSRTLTTGASATTGTITGAWTVTSGSTLEATSALSAGTVTTAAQPNITSVGTLTSLNVTGNTVSGNVYANSGTVRGSLLTGTLTTAAQPNVTSLGTLTSLTAAGTVNLGSIANVKITGGTSGQSITTDGAGNLTFTTISTGSLSNGSSNIAVLNSANLTFSSAGAANVMIITSTGANITGTLNATGNIIGANLSGSLVTGTLTTAAQPNITSLGTLTSATVTGNTVSGNVYANSGTVRGSLLTGTLTTAAQPNVTSLGTLTSLTVSGNITTGNIIGNLANGNSSISINPANGNISLNASGGATPELVVTSTGANITGTAYISGVTTLTDRLIATPDGTSTSYYLPGFSTNYGAGIVGAGTSYAGTGGTAWQALGQWSTSTALSGGAYLSLNKSNSATYGVHGAVAADTTVGAIGFSGSDGAKFVGTADIVSQVDGAVSTTNVPGRIVFKTNPGGAIPVEVMRINSQGNVGIGTTIPAYELDVAGNARVTTSLGVGTTPSGTAGEINATTLTISGNANVGNLTATNSSNVAGVIKLIRAVNGTQDIALIPRAGPGSYNALTGADDALINFGNISAVGNANLTIAPWANANTGIRIQSVSNTATIFLNATNTNVSAALNIAGQLISTVATGTAPLVVSSTTQVANLNAATAGTASVANSVAGANVVGAVANATFATTAGSATTFTSTTQNSQFNSIGVGTAASTTAGEIRATNNITAYYSDGRLKNIEGTIENPIDKIKQVSGVYYRSNDIAASYGYTDDKKQVGVIAQEIEKVLPEIVVPAPFDIGKDDSGNEYSISGENYKTVHYDKIIPLLIEAIKEQQRIIDQQTTKIDEITVILSKLQ